MKAVRGVALAAAAGAVAVAGLALMESAPAAAAVDATVHPGVYRAAECRTVDGDTAQLRLTWTVQDVTLTTVRTVRVEGIDTPERGQPGFGPAKSFTDRFLGDNLCEPDGLHDLVVTASGLDKYGRDLVAIAAEDTDLAASLLTAELAVTYDGGAR